MHPGESSLGEFHTLFFNQLLDENSGDHMVKTIHLFIKHNWGEISCIYCDAMRKIMYVLYVWNIKLTRQQRNLWQQTTAKQWLINYLIGHQLVIKLIDSYSN